VTPGGRFEPQGEVVPIWMRPPSWMYLPHLYPPWVPRGGDQGGQRIEEGTGAAERGRDDERPIRGRHQPPGAEDGADVGATIRGPISGPGPCSADADNRSRAQRMLDARNAHLRRSLEAHAERVAKKRGQAEHSGGQLSATDRLDALRRRIADRVSARGIGRHGNSAAATPEAGGMPSVVSSAGRNELHQQMHFARQCMGISDAPPCMNGSADTARDEQSGSLAVGADDHCAELGRPVMSSDAAHEASRVAWHDVALVRDRQR
jgi:hypothetical protein